MLVSHSLPTPSLFTPPAQRVLSDAAFERCMLILAAGWPREPLPSQTLLVYRAVLSHLPDDLAIRAVWRAVATATFFPKPAEVLARAHEILSEEGLAPPPVEQAWLEVLNAIRHHTRAASLHPLTARALDHIGGLYRITQSNTTDLPHFERSFKHIYRTLAGRHFLSLAGLARQLDHPELAASLTTAFLPPEPPAPGDTEYVPDPN